MANQLAYHGDADRLRDLLRDVEFKLPADEQQRTAMHYALAGISALGQLDTDWRGRNASHCRIGRESDRAREGVADAARSRGFIAVLPAGRPADSCSVYTLTALYSLTGICFWLQVDAVHYRNAFAVQHLV